MSRNILAIKIGLRINYKIYVPLINHKRDLFRCNYFTDYFYTFLDETILRLDVQDSDYFVFQSWKNDLYNNVYKEIANILRKHLKDVGDSLFFALKRVFENIKEYKV